MLHGCEARFHAGSVGYLTGFPDPRYADEPCELVRFDLARRQWGVRLRHSRFGGAEIWTDERYFNLAYCCQLPACDAVPARLLGELESSKGRGLSSLRAFSPGEMIFQEHPMLISGADPSSCGRGRARWHAYLNMQEQARQDDDEAAEVLRIFEAMSRGPQLEGKIKALDEEIDQTIDSISAGKEGMAIPGMMEHLRAIMREVQLIWHTNQFQFSNGSGRAASALFRQASLMNHSCHPNVDVKCQMEALVPGAQRRDDGRISTKALSNIGAGDELLWNYGPDDLPSWPAGKRRDYLLGVFGFICGCSRCEEEANGSIVLDLFSMD